MQYSQQFISKFLTYDLSAELEQVATNNVNFALINDMEMGGRGIAMDYVLQGVNSVVSRTVQFFCKFLTYNLSPEPEHIGSNNVAPGLGN